MVEGRDCEQDVDCGSQDYVCVDGTCTDPLNHCRPNLLLVFTDGREHQSTHRPVLQSSRTGASHEVWSEMRRRYSMSGWFELRQWVLPTSADPTGSNAIRMHSVQRMRSVKMVDVSYRAFFGPRTKAGVHKQAIPAWSQPIPILKSAWAF